MDEVRWRETDGWSPTFFFEVNNLFLLPLFLLIVVVGLVDWI